MLIKREAILKMIDAYPELYFNNDLDLPEEECKWTYLLFDVMHEEETKRYLSEDYVHFVVDGKNRRRGLLELPC